MKKKVIIHEFNPEIYPFKLWVSCTDEYNPLNERFCKGNNLDNLNKEILKTHEAVTFLVKDRSKNGSFGCLVVFTEKRYFTIQNMAHEASHVVDFLWEHIGEKYPGDEAKAYFTGWVVKCMNKVRINKFEE